MVAENVAGNSFAEANVPGTGGRPSGLGEEEEEGATRTRENMGNVEKPESSKALEEHMRNSEMASKIAESKAGLSIPKTNRAHRACLGLLLVLGHGMGSQLPPPYKPPFRLPL